MTAGALAAYAFLGVGLKAANNAPSAPGAVGYCTSETTHVVAQPGDTLSGIIAEHTETNGISPADVARSLPETYNDSTITYVYESKPDGGATLHGRGIQVGETITIPVECHPSE